jgi:hypothetical protein
LTKLWAFENVDIPIWSQLSNIKAPELPGSVTSPAKLYGGGRYREFAHKSARRKKTAIKKNSTVIDREFDYLSITVEFFDLRIFSLGALL